MFKLPSFKEILSKSFIKNEQSLSINGDNNNVHQNFHIHCPRESTVKDEEYSQEFSRTHHHVPLIQSENWDSNEHDEIKRILEYRKIATEGDSQTSLNLLEGLKSDRAYTSGYFAFRLYFNIGIIKQNTGEIVDASNSLRAAYGFYPNSTKAQAGLAFAELIDSQYDKAFERAKCLIEIEGDHKSLAGYTFYYAAKKLRKKITDEENNLGSLKDHDIQAARLEYLREVNSSSYSEELEKAFELNSSSEIIGSMWALQLFDNIQQNQAYILGAKMPDEYNDRAQKGAEILYKSYQKTLAQRPINKLLFPSHANNAAVSLRLIGDITAAAQVIDNTLKICPELTNDFARLRAILYLLEDKEVQALEFINSFKEQPETRILAAEINAKLGNEEDAIKGINALLCQELDNDVRFHALKTKAYIGINAYDRKSVDESVEELVAENTADSELVILKSAYDRAFRLKANDDAIDDNTSYYSNNELISSLNDVESWDFFTLLRASDELLARDYNRECADLLKDRVSFLKESPALQNLCDACIRGNLSSLASEISSKLSSKVKNSVFGLRFDINVYYLSGEISKVLPLARKLYEGNKNSIKALLRYIHALLRTNNKNRVKRVLDGLSDQGLSGTISEKQDYVNVLVHCGETSRARKYAYQLYCENQNDNRAWLALSSSIISYSAHASEDDDLDISFIKEDAAFEVEKPNGEKQTFIIESNQLLIPMREGNISLDHPIAKATLSKKINDTFVWPFGEDKEPATIRSIKHKAVNAFHYILQHSEEFFPEATSFKSIQIDTESENGLDHLKKSLQQRVEFSQQKARDYYEGSYPIAILSYHLGIDPIDAALSLKHECGFSHKVSSCTSDDQRKAAKSLMASKDKGILLDATSVFILRRLNLVNEIEQEFGKISITQNTIDVFNKKLVQIESNCFVDPDDGRKRTANLSISNGQILVSELDESEVNQKLYSVKEDITWLKDNCQIIPSIAKADPPDSIIKIKYQEWGGFFDDIFAADGSDKLLISDDFFIRKWAKELFDVEGVWLQALLFYLQKKGLISSQRLVKSTIYLCEIGQEALSIDVERLLAAVEMYKNEDISKYEFEIICSLIGQDGADIQSHFEVVSSTIDHLWHSRVDFFPVNKIATSIILRMMLRNQNYNDIDGILSKLQQLFRQSEISVYIYKWRIGHFL
ncbi:PIN domain-containing protein [Kiloniella majae]|uniref:PIN domain-containing protein n=1 Tax=Kiloniella majae TaxID=1938558 RepID=UPI000A277114|nr:hypothetical protein [Kiloniella majae]